MAKLSSVSLFFPIAQGTVQTRRGCICDRLSDCICYNDGFRIRTLNAEIVSRYWVQCKFMMIKYLSNSLLQWTWVGLTDCQEASGQCEEGYFRYKDSTTYKPTSSYKFIKVRDSKSLKDYSMDQARWEGTSVQIRSSQERTHPQVLKMYSSWLLIQMM